MWQFLVMLLYCLFKFIIYYIGINVFILELGGNNTFYFVKATAQFYKFKKYRRNKVERG